MTSEALTTTPEAISAEEQLARIMTASFRFSQGSPNLQTNILQYVTCDFGFDETLITEASKLAEAQALEVLNRGHAPLNFSLNFTNNEDAVSGEMGSLREKMRIIARSPEPISKKGLLANIRDGIIRRDSDFLRDEGTRFVGAPDGRYFSYFVRHAMLRAATGTSEYDAMFDALNVSSEALTATQTGRLQAVINEHLRHNPDDSTALGVWMAEHPSSMLAQPVYA